MERKHDQHVAKDMRGPFCDLYSASSPAASPLQKEVVVQVRHYAIYLGMDPDAHPELLFLAKYAMDTELPADLTAHFDADGVEYFHSTATGVSQYEHPLDEPFYKLYEEVKAKKQGGNVLDTVEIRRVTVKPGTLRGLM
jgi:hypothetical protein